MPINDRSLLAAALVGYEQERERIVRAMAEIRSQLGGKRPTLSSGANTGKHERKRRTMSAAARKRIAAAQKTRWAAYKKQHAKAASRFQVFATVCRGCHVAR